MGTAGFLNLRDRTPDPQRHYHLMVGTPYDSDFT